MAISTQYVTLDVTKDRLPSLVRLGQGDKNGTQLVATILDDGEPFSLTGYTVRFAMRLPDNYASYGVNGTVSGNQATFLIDESYAASVAGKTDVAYVEILQGDTVICSTSRMNVIVLPSAYEGVDPAHIWDNGLDEAIARANAAAEAAEGVVLQDVPLMSTAVRGGAKLGSGLNIVDGALYSNASSYDTVADMQADTTLVEGMICHTLGFHAAGDGGAAWYKVTDDATANGMDVLTLSSGVAVLQIEVTVNPEMLGAIADGITDDSSIINYGIATYLDLFRFNAKSYKADIVTPLNTYVTLDLNSAIINGTITVSAYTSYGDKNHSVIKNGYVVNDGNAQAILIKDNAIRVSISDIDITTTGDGIVIGETGNYSSDCIIRNCFINTKHGYEDNDNTGILCKNADNKILYCRIYGFMTGVSVRSSDIIDGVHALYRGDFSTNWNNAVAFKFRSYPIFSNCYIDTYKHGFYMLGSGSLQINDLEYYSWRNDTGNITEFLQRNGNACALKIEGMNLVLDNVTSFQFTSYTDDAATRETFMSADISGIICSSFSKIYAYDVLRVGLFCNFKSTNVSGGSYYLVGRYFMPNTINYYMARIFSSSGTEHIIIINRNGNNVTVSKPSTDTSSLTLIAVQNNSFIDIYAKYNSDWLFFYSEPSNGLIPISPVYGVSDPIAQS